MHLKHVKILPENAVFLHAFFKNFLTAPPTLSLPYSKFLDLPLFVWFGVQM